MNLLSFSNGKAVAEAAISRTFKVPLAHASHEDDYRTAWAFFEARGAVSP